MNIFLLHNYYLYLLLLEKVCRNQIFRYLISIFHNPAHLHGVVFALHYSESSRAEKWRNLFAQSLYILHNVGKSQKTIPLIIMTTLTEVFWVTFVATVSGMIIKLASMCYKSKCKEVEVCCLKIVRDTAAEAHEEEYRIEHNQSSSPISGSQRNLTA